jgi:flagellar basal body rod protein FlgG
VHNDTIYIADSYNNKIKSIAIGSLQVRTVAGSGKQGDADGHSSVAQFSEPAGLLVVGDRMFIADTNNHKIRVFEFDTGVVSTLKISGL